MADHTTTLAVLKDALRHFAAERAWEPFHSPKNLAMGLAVETAELMEHFLLVDCEASRTIARAGQKRGEVADELADVGCHLLNLCNAMEIDLSDAIQAKMAKNAQKYPVEKYRGRFEV